MIIVIIIIIIIIIIIWYITPFSYTGLSCEG
jgi:hypothetical protein